MRLTLEKQPGLPLDLRGLTRGLARGMSADEVGRLPIWQGRQSMVVADWFRVEGDFTEDLEIVGDLSRCDQVGAGWSLGRLVVRGSCGHFAGAEISGGVVVIHGDCGDDAGVGMSGGALHVVGNVGDRLGGALSGATAGMQGGEITVSGQSGDRTGEFMRRGLIAVRGRVSGLAGRGAIAGTIVSGETFGAHAGFELKRGSLISLGVPAATSEYDVARQESRLREVSWKRAGKVDSVYLRLLFRRLAELSAPVDPETAEFWMQQCNPLPLFDRFLGDQLALGRGEWLIPSRQTVNE